MITGEGYYKKPFANGWLDSAVTFRKCAPYKISFVLLNLTDLVLTVIAAHLGLQEMNHFVRVLLQVPALLVVIKAVIPVLIAWVMPGRLLLPSVALLAGVTIWNLKELTVLYL
ncbi:MAG: DUF5658 family protein [Dehalococcoidales bacterium]|nr:DUF5658 family protein [Dehalococcoidales bacterium]